jgi:phosphatidylglycerophosphatase A
MKYAIWKYPIHFLANGFGTGLMPFAPGTFGTLVGVAVFWLMASMDPVSYAAVVIAMFVAGIFICAQTARDVDAIDPGFIVYDEVVGFLVAMYLLPTGLGWIAAGFVVFRIFDIWKPFPIHYIENHLGLGSGIMTDDVIAGIYTLMVLHTARLLILSS